MSHLDDPNDFAGGSGGDDTPVEKMTRLALETRVRELQRENAALKLDLEAIQIHVTRDSQLFHAIAVEGIPVDKQEMEELKANSKSLRQLLTELEQPEQGK